MDIADCNNNVVILNEEEKSNEFQVNSIWIVYEVIYAYLKLYAGHWFYHVHATYYISMTEKNYSIIYLYNLSFHW